MTSILSATAAGCLKKKSLSICFSAIFDFHFRENPRFRHEFQALEENDGGGGGGGGLGAALGPQWGPAGAGVTTG